MVHFFGYPQKHKKFLKFAKKKNIFLIEDNCHSLPIKLDNMRLGKIGHIGSGLTSKNYRRIIFWRKIICKF